MSQVNEYVAQFTLAQHLLAGNRAFGYWCVLNSPLATERLASLDYDYIVVDEQHGLAGYQGVMDSLIAIKAGGNQGLVRVAHGDVRSIGLALDAGAAGVIVPLVETAQQAHELVQAKNYPPFGRRSYGPLRPEASRQVSPLGLNESILCFAMIETRLGLENLAEICAVPGLSGVYIGPSDLRLALGGSTHNDPTLTEELERAILHIRDTAHAAGILAGVHTPGGEIAQYRATQRFDVISIASDANHLVNAAHDHLQTARRQE